MPYADGRPNTAQSTDFNYLDTQIESNANIRWVVFGGGTLREEQRNLLSGGVDERPPTVPDMVAATRKTRHGLAGTKKGREGYV